MKTDETARGQADTSGAQGTTGPEEAGGPGGAANPVGEVDDLRSRLEAAEAKSRENWDLFLRARADLENYRRRMERDVAAMVRRGKNGLILRLLDLVDSVERAAAWDGDGEAAGAGGGATGGAVQARPSAADQTGGARAGVALIHRQFLKVLADEGVTPIESLGQPFDPRVHEAIDVRFDPEVEVPTVTVELQKGYLHGEDVLRPARVQVTQPPG